MPRKAAVFVQTAADDDLERKLVEIILVRDLCVENLAALVQDVKNNLKPLNDETISANIVLMTKVRNATIDLLLHVAKWQKQYTQIRRPEAYGGDYMLRLLKSVEFVNTATIKRTFNFQIGRGNLFLLPIVNAKKQPPVRISEQIKTELEAFSNADIDRLKSATDILVKSLPPRAMEQIMPLDFWAANRWKPSVLVGEESPSPDHKTLLRPKSLGQHNRAGPVQNPIRGVDTAMESKIHQGSRPSSPKPNLPPISQPRKTSHASVASVTSKISALSERSASSISSSKSIAVKAKADNDLTNGARVESGPAQQMPSAPVERSEINPLLQQPTRGISTFALRNWFLEQQGERTEVIDVAISDPEGNSSTKGSKQKK